MTKHCRAIRFYLHAIAVVLLFSYEAFVEAGLTWLHLIMDNTERQNR